MRTNLAAEPMVEMTDAPKSKFHEHHLIIRNIVAPLQANPAAGMFSVDHVDAYIGDFLKAGWILVNTHFISHSNDGDIFAWILVR